MQLKLEQSHQNQLVDLLLNCDVLKSQSGQQSLLDQLSPEIQHKVNFGAKDNSKTRMTAILKGYLSFTTDLESLLKAVLFLEERTLAFQELEAFVQQLKEISLASMPHSLKPPPPPEKFGGRATELANLKKQLTQEQANIGLTAVKGQGGIGKTTLARQAAHELFYDDKAFRAVLWVEVKPKPNVDTMLLDWAKLGNPSFATNDQPVEKFIPLIKYNLERLIAEEGIKGGSDRILIVFDDVWEDGIAVIKLLKQAIPYPTYTSILITTRQNQVTARLNAQPIPLNRLEIPEAIKLLEEYLPTELNFPSEKLAELAEVLGGHSLALTLAAKLLQDDAHPITGITRHIERYRESLTKGTILTRLTLDQSDKDENLELSLSYSYDVLKPEEQIRFRALGALIYDKPFDLKLLCYLWNVISQDGSEKAIEEVREWADRLCSLSILEAASETELGGDWYRQHPLLHAYALALLKNDPAEYETTLTRYYDGTIVVAGQFNELPPEKWKQLDPYLPHIFATGDYLVKEYQKWSDLEQHRSQIERAKNFALNIYLYLYRRPEVLRLDWLEMGLEVARQLEEQKQEALFLHQIGLYHRGHGDKKEALKYYEQALLLRKTISDQWGESDTLIAVGVVYSDLGKKTKALEYYQQALPLKRTVGDQEGEATALNNIGVVYSDLGETNKALEYLEQALPLRKTAGDRAGEATTLNNIGGLYNDLRETSKALEYLEQALPLNRTVGNREGEATALNNIGGVYLDLREKSKALKYFEQALSLQRVVGDRVGEAISSFNIAGIYEEWGQLKKAIEWVEKSEKLFQAIKDPRLKMARQTLAHLQTKLTQQHQMSKSSQIKKIWGRSNHKKRK